MITLGLTGSIGMGKSTVAKMFADEGVPVFDADAEVHRLQGPGGALVGPIEAMFPGTTGPAGVAREKLYEATVHVPDGLARLEALIHPEVGRAREAFLAANAQEPLVVLDIPLLFEKGGADRVDKIVVVSAPAEIQRARVIARPGWDARKFERIHALQMPDAEKRARADFVIPTSGSLDETRDHVRRVIACLSPREGR